MYFTHSELCDILKSLIKSRGYEETIDNKHIHTIHGQGTKH